MCAMPRLIMCAEAMNRDKAQLYGSYNTIVRQPLQAQSNTQALQNLPAGSGAGKYGSPEEIPRRRRGISSLNPS